MTGEFYTIHATGLVFITDKFAYSSAAKRNWPLWGGPTRQEQHPTLPSECALAQIKIHTLFNNNNNIFIYLNWVVTRWLWLFYM